MWSDCFYSSRYRRHHLRPKVMLHLLSRFFSFFPVINLFPQGILNYLCQYDTGPMPAPGQTPALVENPPDFLYRYGSLSVYKLDDRPPFVRHLALRLIKPFCSRSSSARNTVLLERLRSEAMVPIAGKQLLSLFARFLRYMYTVTALCGRSAAYTELKYPININPRAQTAFPPPVSDYPAASMVASAASQTVGAF